MHRRVSYRLLHAAEGGENETFIPGKNQEEEKESNAKRQKQGENEMGMKPEPKTKPKPLCSRVSCFPSSPHSHL